MSSQIDLPDPPAFAAATKISRKLSGAGGNFASLICASIPGAEAVDRFSSDDSSALAGRYRIVIDGEPFFARVAGRPREQQFCRIAELLQSLPLEAPAVRASGKAVYSVGNNHVCLLTSWIDGHAPGIDDISAVGASLGKLHQALAKSPLHPTIKLAARQRTAAMQARVDAGLPPFALSIAQELGINLDILNDLPAGPLHGDANPGNILVHDGQVSFCDFEDAVHTYAPLLFDLAMIVERICLPENDAADRVETLFEGYAEVAGQVPGRAGALRDALALINFRAAVLLAMAEDHGLAVQPHEQDKFKRYSADCIARHAELAAIERRIWKMP